MSRKIAGKSGTSGVGRNGRSEPLQVRTHGAKLSELSKVFSGKPVEDLADQLNFYQGYRNEPVPPDPTITSAVKQVWPVKPPPGTGPSNVDFGKPSCKQKSALPQSWFKLVPVEKFKEEKANIPIFGGISEKVTPKFEGCQVKTVLNSASQNISDVIIENVESNFTPTKGTVSAHNESGPIQSIPPVVYGDSSKGPGLFVKLCDQQKLINVVIVSVFNSQNFVIRVPDLELNSKLKKLESDMFQWFRDRSEVRELEQEYFVSEAVIKKRHFYGLLIPEQKECLRVSVLGEFENDTALVYLLDHGRTAQVYKKNIVPLKCEWKELYQLSSHAKCELKSPSKLEQKSVDIAFKNKFMGKLVTIRPIRAKDAVAEYESSSGILFKCSLKFCELEFYNSAQAVLEFLKKRRNLNSDSVTEIEPGESVAVELSHLNVKEPLSLEEQSLKSDVNVDNRESFRKCLACCYGHPVWH